VSAEDEAGNRSNSTAVKFKVQTDLAAPTAAQTDFVATLVDPDPSVYPSGETIEFSLVVTDDITGIKSIELPTPPYTISFPQEPATLSAPVSGSFPATNNIDGLYTMRLTLVDWANNAQSVTLTTPSFDYAGPDVTIYTAYSCDENGACTSESADYKIYHGTLLLEVGLADGEPGPDYTDAAWPGGTKRLTVTSDVPRYSYYEAGYIEAVTPAGYEGPFSFNFTSYDKHTDGTTPHVANKTITMNVDNKSPGFTGFSATVHEKNDICVQTMVVETNPGDHVDFVASADNHNWKVSAQKDENGWYKACFDNMPEGPYQVIAKMTDQESNTGVSNSLNVTAGTTTPPDGGGGTTVECVDALKHVVESEASNYTGVAYSCTQDVTGTIDFDYDIDTFEVSLEAGQGYTAQIYDPQTNTTSPAWSFTATDADQLAPYPIEIGCYDEKTGDPIPGCGEYKLLLEWH
jgi:hypothetical protein